MCATVPSMPVVLMVPLTDLSAAIVIVPVPDAEVVTGGVSSAPVSFTFKSTAKTDALLATNITVAISARTLDMLDDLLMITSPCREALMVRRDHYRTLGGAFVPTVRPSLPFARPYGSPAPR